MKKKLFKVLNCALVVVILAQVLLCMTLFMRTATDRDFGIFGYRFYYIATPSMEPTIPVGAQIVVRSVETEKLQVEDIITFASRDPAIQGYPNTHRIVEITTDEAGNPAYVTKGDNNPTEDPYLVYPQEVYGKVVMITPALKGVLMFYSFVATPTGFMICIIMPLMLIFGLFMRTFIREMRNGNKEARQEAPLETKQESDGWNEMQNMEIPDQYRGLVVVDAVGELQLDAEMLAMIQVLAASYQAEHPGQELTRSEATGLAAALLKMKQKGEGDHGKRA